MKSFSGTCARRTRAAGTAVAAFALAAGVVVSGTGQAQGSQPGGPGDPRPGVPSGRVVQSRTVTQSSARVRDFWTPQRMRSARPAKLLVQRGGRTFRRDAEVPRHLVKPASGPTVRVQGTSGSLGSRTPLASRVSQPYTRLPYRTNGKVFFTSGGDGYVCSGTAVNSANKSTVWTAGHCVNDGAGTFHSNWAFVPAYSSSRPYGTWTARRLFTPTAWSRYASFSYDVGAAVVRPRNGVRLVNRVGGQGIGFNEPAAGSYSSFGYPAASPFNGYQQWRCDSPLRMRDRWEAAPYPMAITCSMTGGSSGGGWLRGISNGVGRVLSVNSYGWGAYPDYMFGPYQGSTALALWTAARSYGL